MIIVIAKATKEDLPKILELQKAAFHNGVWDSKTSPLKQTLSDITFDYQKGVILKVLGAKDEITGSIRAYSNEGTVHIEKLFVKSEFRNRRIGSELLRKIESFFHARRFEVCTSEKEMSKMFKPQGYKPFKTDKTADGKTLFYFEKWR